jgi:hypothetical protein
MAARPPCDVQDRFRGAGDPVCRSAEEMARILAVISG